MVTGEYWNLLEDNTNTIANSTSGRYVLYYDDDLLHLLKKHKDENPSIITDFEERV